MWPCPHRLIADCRLEMADYLTQSAICNLQSRQQAARYLVGVQPGPTFQLAPQPPQIDITQAICFQDIVRWAILVNQAVLPGLLAHGRPRQQLEREDIVGAKLLAPDELD